ncbi:MAG: hypothetical protein EOQ39_30190 [Mesorhizobium sp.]|nr:MAG: hypothetical protein EOQ39_30190 [Mesorhizobium sp.]
MSVGYNVVRSVGPALGGVILPLLDLSRLSRLRR